VVGALEMATTLTPFPEIGLPFPEFKLPATDGKTYSSKEFLKGKPTVVVFMCNHCPYVQAIEERLIVLGRDLQALQIPMLAICSNDEKSYPEDSFENLKKRAEEKSYSFPYLYDQSQEVAKLFGALCTPDFFVYDREGRLAYRGRLDDSWKDASKVQRRELFEAVQLLNQAAPAPEKQTPSMGCSIKWL
jgi:peroxiredoxin